MGARPIDRRILAIVAGIDDPKAQAKLLKMPDDEAEKLYLKHKDAYDRVAGVVAKEKTTKAKEQSAHSNVHNIKTKLRHYFSDKNPFARYKDKEKTMLADKQLPEYHLFEMMRNGETNIGNLVRCCLLIEPDETKVHNALDVVCIPWHHRNNWESMALPSMNMEDIILQQSISLELKKTITEALRSINCQERNASPEPISPATQLPHPRPYCEISAECPYINVNPNYAVIWQILKNNSEGISRDLLKNEAMAITGKSSEEIDEAIDVVISPKDSQGEGRDERASPGYWVEEDLYGLLIMRFPMHVTPNDDQQSQSGQNEILLI